MGFSTLDYAVLALYLVGITVFGSRFRRSHTTVKDYFVGKRQTSWLVISLSIVATETSTLTLIGVPALAYTTYAHPEQGGSLTYLQVVAGYLVARFIISGLFIPASRRTSSSTGASVRERSILPPRSFSSCARWQKVCACSRRRSCWPPC
jgi:solute:Na+ symporter, SSS family